MTFSENLRNLRKEKDYSQEYLAEKMDVTRQTISKWENGTAVPNMKKLAELAELFEVSINDLLGNEYASELHTDEVIDAYTKDEVNAILNQVKSGFNKKSIILSVAVILLVASLILTSITFAVRISSLNIQISNLNDIISQMGYNRPYSQVNDDNDYDYDDRSDYVNYTIVKTYPDRPHIIAVDYKYAPESYSKTDKVYFQIPTSEGIKKIEADNSDGIFTASADVDLTRTEESYLCIENGDKVDLIEIENSYLEEYFSRNCEYITAYVSTRTPIFYNYKRATGINVLIDSISWDENNISADIASATLHIKTDLEKEYTQNLDIKKNGSGSEFSREISIDELTIEKANEVRELYIDLTDENGVIYRLSPEIIQSVDNGNTTSYENTSGCLWQVIFTIDGKQVAIYL